MDRHRAENWLIAWLDWLPADQRDEFTDELFAQFAEVRLDERRAGHALYEKALAWWEAWGDHKPDEEIAASVALIDAIEAYQRATGETTS